MVQGVTVCGTFVTKKILTIIAILTILVLVTGCVLLGFGVDSQCYYNYDYYYYNDCYSTKVSLIVNGGVLISFSVITLVTVCILMGRLQEPPLHAPSTIVTQPYAMPGQTIIVPQTALLYNQANTGSPQQYLSTAATTSEAEISSHYNQHPQPPPPTLNMIRTTLKKHHPDNTTTDLPPTSPS